VSYDEEDLMLLLTSYHSTWVNNSCQKLNRCPFCNTSQVGPVWLSCVLMLQGRSPADDGAQAVCCIRFEASLLLQPLLMVAVIRQCLLQVTVGIFPLYIRAHHHDAAVLFLCGATNISQLHWCCKPPLIAAS
jgi:hypothetical protein